MAINSVTLSKLDAARRQIDTAIDLWAHDGDPVSIHTLTAAAHRIVLDLAERKGSTTILFDVSALNSDEAKKQKRKLRLAETFFKHAKDDPDAFIEFYPSAVPLYLFDAAHTYLELTKAPTAMMIVFMFRLKVLDPGMFGDGLPPSGNEALSIDRLKELPTNKFFEELLPLVTV